MYRSPFSFDSWRHQEITLAELLWKSEQQLQRKRKRRRHRKYGNSEQVYIHSRNLIIHKNFSHLKLSNLK